VSTALRLLIVEDSEDDALLIVRDLQRAGYEPIYERVETEAAVRAALDRASWDVIVSDFNMPRFRGTDAEHRLALYARHQNIRGRCIGHGGVPVELPFPDADPAVPLVLHDACPGQPIDSEQIGLNGFVTLGLDGANLRVLYYDQLCKDGDDFLLEEQWAQQNVGAVGTGVRLGPRGGKLTATRPLQELIR